MASGSNLAFGGLWAGPWLKDVAGLHADGIALNLLFFATLATIAYVVNGTIAAWLGRRGISLIRTMSVGYLLSILLQFPLLWPSGG